MTNKKAVKHGKLAIRHAVDSTRTFPATLCNAPGGKIAFGPAESHVSCKRCRAKLGLGPLATEATVTK